MGCVAPIIITAKRMMQEIWSLGLNWDDELPQSFQEKWNNLENDLQSIQTLKFPDIYN